MWGKLPDTFELVLTRLRYLLMDLRPVLRTLTHFWHVWDSPQHIWGSSCLRFSPTYLKLWQLEDSFWFVWDSSKLGLPWWLRQYRICLPMQETRFDAWVRKIPWSREWQPTPIFLPGEFHGQWWDIPHGFTKSRAQLNDLAHMHFQTCSRTFLVCLRPFLTCWDYSSMFEPHVHI